MEEMEEQISNLRSLLANKQPQQTNEEQIKRLLRANEELTTKQTQHDMENKNLRDKCETLKMIHTQNLKDECEKLKMIRTQHELNMATNLEQTKRMMEESIRKDRHIGGLEDTVVSLKERCKRSGVVIPTFFKFLRSEVEYQNKALDRTVSTVDVSGTTIRQKQFHQFIRLSHKIL